MPVVNGQLLPDIYGDYQAGFERGKARADKAGLSSLMGDYYSQQGNDTLAKMARIDPRTAIDFGTVQQHDTEAKERQMVQHALLLHSAPEAMRPQMYARMLPAIRQLVPEAPDQYGPEVAQILDAVAARETKGAEPYTLSPGSVRYGPDGRIVAENKNFAPRYDSERGGYATPDGFTQVAPPKPDYEGARLSLAQQANERANRAAQDAAEARRLAQRGNAPPGYRFNANDDLERIPGAPQAIGKPLPAPVVNKLTKQAGVYDNNADLISSFKDEYAGNVVGGSLENLAGRLGGERIGISSQGQSDWWQQYNRQKNVVRNELFGSALTPGEQKAFQEADIDPNMDPARIRTNMATQQKIIQRAMQRQAKVWRAQGFNMDAIDAATMPMQQPEAPQAPAQTTSAQKVQEGTVIVDRKTGHRMVRKNGQWIDL